MHRSLMTLTKQLSLCLELYLQIKRTQKIQTVYYTWLIKTV